MLESGAGIAAHGRGETLLHAMPERLIWRGRLAFTLKHVFFAWVEVNGIRRVRILPTLSVSVQVIEILRETRQPSRFSRPSEAVSRRNLCAPWHRPWMLMALRQCIPSCWTSSKLSKLCERIGRTKKLRWRACRSNVAHLQTRWSHNENGWYKDVVQKVDYNFNPIHFWAKCLPDASIIETLCASTHQVLPFMVLVNGGCYSWRLNGTHSAFLRGCELECLMMFVDKVTRLCESSRPQLYLRSQDLFQQTFPGCSILMYFLNT